MWIYIFVSNIWLTGSFILANKWKIKSLSIELITSTTFVTWPGALIPCSIILLKDCRNMDNKYYNVAHLKGSAKPSIFSHMALRSEKRRCLFFNNSMIHFLCGVSVAASFLLLSYRNKWNIECRLKLCKYYDDVPWSVALKCSNVINSIYIDQLPP